MGSRSENAAWIARDLAHVWHPCTQMKDHEQGLPLIPIKSARGVWLEDFEGRRYLDGISSWWVNLFGHSHPYINSKIREQLERLEHVLLAGFTHEPVITLSERLVALAPGGLTRCFYADNGSSAVEVALKMSYHYHRNRGEERPRFLSLTESYHGETLGALAVGDVALYKTTYSPLLMHTLTTKAPQDSSPEAAQEALRHLEDLLQKEGHTLSALILEPLLQCAGGMRMHHPDFVSGAQALCAQKGIHLIADEVATGFGRTGTLFACAQAGITPDFLILSKGLTGGYLPLSVVLTTEEVYGAFYDDYASMRGFLHSHSYTGNPLACAAAHATLDLFEREGWVEKNLTTSAQIAALLSPFETLGGVEGVRQCGMVAALDLVGFPAHRRIGLEVYRRSLQRGVLVRPLGATVYWMPPYVISKEELELLFGSVWEILQELKR